MKKLLILILGLIISLLFTSCKKEELKNLSNKQVIIEESGVINEWCDIVKVIPDFNYGNRFTEEIYDHYGLELESSGIFKSSLLYYPKTDGIISSRYDTNYIHNFGRLIRDFDDDLNFNISENNFYDNTCLPGTYSISENGIFRIKFNLHLERQVYGQDIKIIIFKINKASIFFNKSSISWHTHQGITEYTEEIYKMPTNLFISQPLELTSNDIDCIPGDMIGIKITPLGNANVFLNYIIIQKAK